MVGMEREGRSGGSAAADEAGAITTSFAPPQSASFAPPQSASFAPPQSASSEQRHQRHPNAAAGKPPAGKPRYAPAAAGFSRRHLTECLADALGDYVRQLNGQPCANLHDMAMTVCEKEVVQFALLHHQYNISAAAKMLGISRTTLNKKIAKHQLAAAAASTTGARVGRKGGGE